MASSYDTDVAVLGAGMGGLAAALSLAKAGRSVVLLDRSEPPWRRVGESFDWETPRFLEDLGLDLEKLVEKRALAPKPGVIVWSNSTHRSNDTYLIPPPSYMRLVRRPVVTFHGNRELLDSVLLDEALKAGAQFRVDRVKEVSIEGERVESIELAEGGKLRARFLIDASGRTGLITRAAGIRYRYLSEQMVSLYRRYSHSYDHKGTRVYCLDQGKHFTWAWNIHVDDETTDLGIVVSAECFKELRDQEGSKEAVFWRIIDEIPALEEFRDRSRASQELHACSFRNYVGDRSSGENWIAVGESAFLVDPISSAGVTVALRSARFASMLIGEALDSRKPFLCRKSCRQYHRRVLIQVTAVNTLVNRLKQHRRLWNYVGMSVYTRLLTLVQWHINWLSSTVDLRSRPGHALFYCFQRSLVFTVTQTLHLLERMAPREA